MLTVLALGSLRLFAAVLSLTPYALRLSCPPRLRGERICASCAQRPNMLDRVALANLLTDWLAAWNRHDLAGVLEPMADDVVFEHWNGRVICGKSQLARVWQPWFASHGDFHFDMTGCCVDEMQQAFNFEWRLTWLSPEPGYVGRPETREGVDLIRLRDGKISSKRTYTKTALIIDGLPIVLKARI